jgi:hypothetical protein
VADADVISAFWDGMTCHTLVYELGHEQQKTTKELLGIATRHASGEEEVGAAFILGNVKAATSDGRTTPSKATINGARKGTKGSKKGQNHRPWHIAVAVRCMSRPSNVMSSARHGSLRTILRNFSKRPAHTTHTLSSRSSRTTP